MEQAEPSVVTRIEGRAGTILLNRPRALNALDQGMIDALAGAAARFRDDPSVDLVVLEGAGGRAFCAGGDVRAIRAAALAGDAAVIERFFAGEYGLNRLIAEFPKPWISLIDGVCMGGGIGVSVHGSHRVVSEAALLAMPETAIALFPDVGTSHVLPRLPGARGAMGKWLALTGARLAGAEAVEAGMATHHVPRERLPALREALLAAEGTEWARAQAELLRRMSPTSLAVTLELLRRGAGMDLPACLEMELRLTRAVTRHPDFAEGVRAVLIDKDNAPRWQPPGMGEVDPAAVRAMFGG